MENIKLVYFRGCPNYKSVKKLLTRIGVSFDEINQDDLSDGHPLKRFTSPTILKNEKLIFGEKISDASGGCSIRIPERWELERKLKG
jgi:glutaredoxin